MTLNGCNDGHMMAPILAKLWRIPVAGALTGTIFESIFELKNQEQKFYHANAPNDFFKYRMRPENAQYNKTYGAYKQGLSFYKFFCADIPRIQCLTGMARSMFMNVSPVSLANNLGEATSKQFAINVREWLCPSTDLIGDAFQTDCMRELANQETALNRNYTPFRGKSLSCTFETCYTNPICLTVHRTANHQTCPIVEPVPPSSTTFVDEYFNYLEGYKYLLQGHSF